MAEKDKKKQLKQTEAEKALANEVLDQLMAAYTAKEALGLHGDWRRQEDYYRSIQNPPENEDDPGSVTNMVFPLIESQVSDLVDEPLEIQVVGEEPSDEPFARDVTHILEWLWSKNDMVVKIDRWARQWLKFGTAIWKGYYDPYANKGKGLIVGEPISPVTFFPDPKVKSAWQLQDADFIIHATTKSLEYLKKVFGERAELVQQETNPVVPVEIFEGEDAANASNITANKALLIERWTKKPDGGLRLTQVANGILLYDSEILPKGEGKPRASFYRHGRYPFVAVPCYPVEGRLWGIGDIEVLMHTQDLINELDDQVRLNARLNGNPQTIVGTASGINPRRWTAKAGLKIPARDPMAINQLTPPSMPSYILNRRAEAKQEIELLSGRPDVVEGRRPGGLRAASAILALQEAGNKRVKHKKLFMEKGLEALLELWLEYVKEFYTEEQAFRIMGREPSYIWFRGSDLQKVPKLIPGPTVPGQETPPLVPLHGDNGKQETKEAEFDIRVSIGAGLPHNRAFLYQTIIELSQNGIFTPTEARLFIRDFLNWPVIDPYNPLGQLPQQSGQALAQNRGTPSAASPGPGPDQEALQTPQQVPPELLMAVVNMLGGGKQNAS